MTQAIPTVLPGTPPGTLKSPTKALETSVRVFFYQADYVHEKNIEDLLNNTIQLADNECLWISVVGLKDLNLVKRLGAYFDLHSLALEDVLGTHQRPKVDTYDDYEFIVGKVIKFEHQLHYQQMSVFLGERFVISFLESPTELVDNIAASLLNPRSKLSHHSVEYLAYRLMDYMIDGYFSVLSHYSDALDEQEAEVLKGTSTHLVHNLQRIKRDLRVLKLFTWSHRDLLNTIIRNEKNMVNSSEVLYFRDCHDHVVQQMDIIESQKELATSLLDIYLSTITNRLNTIMKTLTVISILFMPPTFLAAVWGMNFEHMHELRWLDGYGFAWAMMIFSSILAYVALWYYNQKRVKL